MKEIELFVYTTDAVEPKSIHIDENLTVIELLKKVHPEKRPEDLNIFIEDAEEPLPPNKKLNECGLKPRHKLHCTRCKKVQVVVFYNDLSKADSFPPSVKVKKVLKWAIDAFELRGADGQNKVLRLKDPPGTELLNDAHIGSYITPGSCELKLCLTPIVRVEG